MSLIKNIGLDKLDIDPTIEKSVHPFTNHRNGFNDIISNLIVSMLSNTSQSYPKICFCWPSRYCKEANTTKTKQN